MSSSKRQSKPFQVPSTSENLRAFIPVTDMSVIDVILFYEHIIFLWQDYHISISYQQATGFDVTAEASVSVIMGLQVDLLLYP